MFNFNSLIAAAVVTIAFSAAPANAKQDLRIQNLPIQEYKSVDPNAEEIVKHVRVEENSGLEIVSLLRSSDDIPIDHIVTATALETGEQLGKYKNGDRSRLLIPNSFYGVVAVRIDLSNLDASTKSGLMAGVSIARRDVPDPHPRPIRLGNTISGSLASSVDLNRIANPVPGSARDFFEFSANEGDVIRFRITSAEGMQIASDISRRYLTHKGDEIARHYRPASQLNEELIYVIPESGLFLLELTNADKESGLEYSMRMDQLPNATGSEAYRPIGIGEKRTTVRYGTYTLSDEEKLDQLIALSEDAKSAVEENGGGLIVRARPKREHASFTIQAGFITPAGFTSIAESAVYEGSSGKLAIDSAYLGSEQQRNEFRILLKPWRRDIGQIELSVELGE